MGEGNCLSNIEVIYINLGDYAQALELYQRSLKIRDEIGDRAGVVSSLNNIGIIYENQSDYCRALHYYHRGLKIDEEIGDRGA